MPLYQYQCESCAHRFEVIQKFSDAKISVCPECGGPVQKLLSSPAIQFKGSGFYLTDYGRGTTSKSEGGGSKGGKTDAAGKGGSESKGEGSSGESSKGESAKGDSSKSESKKSESSSSPAPTTSTGSSSTTSAPAKKD